MPYIFEPLDGGGVGVIEIASRKALTKKLLGVFNPVRHILSNTHTIPPSFEM